MSERAMTSRTWIGPYAGLLLALVAAPSDPSRSMTKMLLPSRMMQIGTIDERFQSFNIEMLEVTGGKFWKPYGPELEAALRQTSPAGARASGDTPAGMNPALYQYRPPIDLTNT